jgi:cation:H+ antiporter
MVLTSVGFLVSALLILYCGRRLTQYGKQIATALRWEQGWIGLILMASVTSLPELTVGIGSVSIVGSADLALGDILGSCAFNLGILSLLDAFVRKRALLSNISVAHALAGAMSIVLTAMVGLGLYLERDIALTQWIGVTGLLFIGVYLLAMQLLYRYEKREQKRLPLEDSGENIKLRSAIALYAGNAVIVVAAAIALPQFAKDIATASGLSESFIGTVFLAASTSLPEVAVSYAAVRIGALDLATGSLLGSNLFNIFILAIDDSFYTDGYLLQDASNTNLISVFFVIMMTAVAIAGQIYRVQHKRFLLAWDALVIFLLYLVNIIILYALNRM